MSHQLLSLNKATGRIVIIGAGVFGLSTALELSMRGYKDVTVLDRYLPPALDGSSVDVSRIIRNDYADPLYAKLASEALPLWESFYKPFYHRCGMVLTSTTNNKYLAGAHENIAAAGLPHEKFDDVDELRHIFPAFQGSAHGSAGYANPIGGWADAGGAIDALAKRCSTAGVNFVTGPQRGVAVGFATTSPRPPEPAAVRGVRTASGDTILADAVVVAAGAWTNQLLDLRAAMTSTAQPVGFIQLSEAEARELADAPVLFDFDTGFFSFPPTPESHRLKVARHGWGYERRVEMRYEGAQGETRRREVSSPDGAVKGRATAWLPQDADRDLRAGLRKMWPRFAEREWQATRLCWYSDTPTGDFIVDWHPDMKGVFMASAGSGHAFKFLPILGKYVSDCFEGVASLELREKWAFRPESDGEFAGDGSRGGSKRRQLSAMELAKL